MNCNRKKLMTILEKNKLPYRKSMRKEELIQILNNISKLKKYKYCNFTVKELKKKLKSKNLKTSGLKKDLIERLIEYDKKKDLIVIKKKSYFNFQHLFNSSVESFCKDLANKKTTKIKERRKKIYNKLNSPKITKENYKKILNTKFLSKTFKLYDKYFFNNYFKKFSEEKNCFIVICWKKICSKELGYSIKLSSNLVKINFSKNTFDFLKFIDKKFWSGGIYCKDFLECFQITFEHELIHSLLDCFCQKEADRDTNLGNWKLQTKSDNGHSRTFMSILNNTFGHTHWVHALFKKKSKGKKLGEYGINEKNINIGQTIHFFKGNKIINGKVIKKDPKYVTIKTIQGYKIKKKYKYIHTTKCTCTKCEIKI